MGRGTSKAGGGSAGTPSGVTYQQFMQMSDDQKYQVMGDIIDDDSIVVPDYLDGSDTSKVLYALGMNQKPTVVDDATLDSMSGREIYRTVYETGALPPPSSDAILDQIRNGDYTQLSGKGGSYHGRALYFATDFSDSAGYGSGERNAMVSRAKISPTANIRSENSLDNQMYNDTAFTNSNAFKRATSTDQMALYALSKGVDGWYSGSYTMMVNRGALTMSSRNKKILKVGSKKTSRNYGYNDLAHSWSEAGDA